MPEIVERDGKYCLEGYGDADACFDSEDEAKAARDKLSLSQNKALTFASLSNWLTPEAEERLTKTVAERVWDGIQQRLGWKSDGDEATGFKVAGNNFLCIPSNNFKDRDGEVFPESALNDYVSRVDMGVTPLPEVQVWHAGKSTAIGTVDWVGTHGHFLMAMGHFYGAAPAQAAKAYYTKHARDTGISHGFTYPAAEFDGKHYRQFNTFEISLLPRGTEANWFTSLEGVKAMALDDRKVKYLKDVFGEEHATRILADWDARGKALEALNVEFKDFVQPETEGAPAVGQALKQALVDADKAFKDLFPDLMEGSAEAVTAALEAVKAVKAQDVKVAEMETAFKTLQAEVNELRANPPRSVQQGGSYTVETSHLSAALQKDLKEQNTVRHPFFGNEVDASTLR